ncbi:MAG: alpha/beta fold hydrolase [Clostridia bacterium]|nr:alpha/beta fold hydrolase [Clostridia bacterium]
MENITEKFGFKCLEFTVFGRYARLICPNSTPNGKWLLKTEYADAFPEFEIEMLNKGYHVAYIENQTRWHVDADDEAKLALADFLKENYALNEKCVTVGMSCGGLQSIYFAAKYPQRVAAMFVDAPVTNLLSCPAYVGNEEKMPEDFWGEFYNATKITLSELLNYRNHPIDRVPDLLKNNIPIFMAAGDSDEVVPYTENGAHLEKYYKENNGTIEIAMKKGVGHHPHCLPDNTPIIEFVEKHYI